MLPDWLNSGFFWSSLCATLLLPPASLLLLAFAGLMFLPRRPNAGWILLILSLIALWALATPYIGRLLLNATGETRPFDASTLKFYKIEDRPQLIVVLGGGRIKGALEYGGEELKDRSIARVRYAARLQRETGLPLMTSGGKPDGGGVSEGNLMKRALEYEFGVPVKLVENESDNTVESAQLCAEILRTAGYSRILLVTDYWHMRRARAAFKHAGLDVVAAPMGFHDIDVRDPAQWLPSAEGLGSSRIALKELVGSLLYQARVMLFPGHAQAQN